MDVFESSDKIKKAEESFKVIDKQAVFDRFLTYRKRLSRLACVQALFLFDVNKKAKNLESSTDLFNGDSRSKRSIEPMLICQEVVYFYKNMFFTVAEYGWNKKSKKIDEAFMFEVISFAIKNIEKIDQMIANNLNERWSINKLDFTLRAILRSAAVEILLPHKVEKAVLCSEYTNVTTNFFCGKEIGFVNGIIDSMYTKYRQDG